MNNALVFAATQYLRRGKFSFLKKTLAPQKYQARFLFSLIKAHRDTEFGQIHRFADIKTVEDYRRQVPIRIYSDFEPWIQRMAEGEEQVLIKESPIYFNITSGSTGTRKLIPVTKASRKCVQRASVTTSGFVADAAYRNGLPIGKLLFPASVNPIGKTKSGIEFAPVSTSDLKLSNFISRSLMSSPFAAHQVGDLKSRHYICLLFALANPNLRMMAETFPVTTLRLCQFLDKHSGSLVADLKSHQLTDWLKIDDSQRSLLLSKLRCSEERIQELESIVARDGRLTPQTAWPNLSFMVTARGGTSDFYFNKFPEYFGDLPIFGGVYSSAEATYGVHRDFGTDGVILALESGFFEFIPEAEWENPQPLTVLPHEVEVGKRYRIVVTNFNGFYRYDVGDVVEVEGFQNQTPIFIFRHRYKGFITSVGEKTTEYHVTKVMSQLEQEMNVTLVNFCITLTDEIPPRYVVNVEIPAHETLQTPCQFIQRYDELMNECHTMYRLKRQDQVKTPILRLLKPGSFDQLQQDMIRKGAAETQIKMPKISNDRQLFDESAVKGEYSCDQPLVMQ